ncbi:MAG: DUF1549 domain-containing protein [Akkermansiaceae bacterium]
MRRSLILFPLLALQACQKDEPEAPPEARVISYSREIRPLLINNCLHCHADLPLHDPTSWNLLHPHETHPSPPLLKEWVDAGSKVDQHWALTPIQEIAVTSLDDFTKIGGNAISDPRKAPPAFFTGSVEETLAGDLLSGADPDRAIATNYFRRGEDTPTSRTRKAAHEFLGLRIECAECHDHPHEPVSTKDYRGLVELFTTPYDEQLLPTGLRPPLHIPMTGAVQTQHAELQEKLTSLLTPPALDLEAYQDWLANEGNVPKINGLIASYDFESRQLTNLAPNSPIKEGGADLIAENGVHGQGLLFDEKNYLSLHEHGIQNETTPFAISLWLKLAPGALAETSLVRIGTPDRGFELRILNSKVQIRWTRAWPENAIATTSVIPLLAPYRWGHVVVSSDGSRRPEGLRIFFNGRAVEQDHSSGKLIKPVLVNEQPMTLQGASTMIDELQLFGKTLTAIESAQLFDGKNLTEAFVKKHDLGEFYTQRLFRQDSARTIEIANSHQQLLDLENSLPEYPVLRHHPVTSSRIKDGAQSVFTAKDRLEFARSINRNLLARSVANEVWRAHFGTRLAHDLGHGSELPKHPELLEWLAGKLVEFQYDPNKLAALIQGSNLWLREWTAQDDSRVACPRLPETP